MKVILHFRLDPSNNRLAIEKMWEQRRTWILFLVGIMRCFNETRSQTGTVTFPVITNERLFQCIEIRKCIISISRPRKLLQGSFLSKLANLDMMLKYGYSQIYDAFYK